MSTVKAKSESYRPVFDLVDSIGDFIEYWGFKKIHGKIWALVFLAEKPVDANYLIEHLGVSKALVSMTLKDLLSYKVVLESSLKASTVHYESNPDMADVILDVLMGREAKMLAKIKSSCEIVNCLEDSRRGPLASKERAEKLQNMVNTADKALKIFISLRQFNFKEISQSLNLRKNGA